MKSEISVIVPIYNDQNTLGETLRSLQEQSFRDFEVLLVDNGSEDESKKIIKEYCAADERFKDIGVDDNIGVSAARNKGMDSAKGKYIYFLDSDDYISSYALSELWYVAESKNLDLVLFDGKAFSTEKKYSERVEKLNKYFKRTLESREVKTGQELFRDLSIRNEHTPNVTMKMFKLSFLKKYNIRFEENIIHEDNLFSIISIMNAERAYYYKKILHFRRVRENSITTKEISIANYEGYYKTFDKMTKDAKEYDFREGVLDAYNYELKKIHGSLIVTYDLLQEKDKRKVDLPSYIPISNDIKISVVIPVYNGEVNLHKSLTSIKKQTLINFEVIIINDGSIDRTQEIIEDFKKNDHRFKYYCQKNSGVAASRNKGIELSKGKYIVFADSDDEYTENALESLYETAEKNNAELVIGMLQRESNIQSYKFPKSIELTKKKQIKNDDPILIYSFTVTGKIYLRSAIEKYDIRFENFMHTEDGVFSMKCIKHFQKIFTCSEVVYKYHLELAYMTENVSATRIMEKRMVEELISALKRIETLISDKPPEFRQEFYMRAIAANLLPQFYRHLRQIDEDALDILRDAFEEYKKYLTDEQWQELKKNNPDLMLEKGIMTGEEADQNPLVTVAVTKGVSEDHKEMFMKSLYCQDSPFYRVVEEKKDHPDFMKNTLKECTTPYITFVDHDIMYNDNTLRKMQKTLYEEKCDFVSGIMCGLDEGKRKDLPYFNIAFNADRLNRSRWDIFDRTFANKLFVTEALKKCKAMDMEQIYSRLSHVRKRNSIIMTALTEEQLMCGAGSMSLNERIEACTYYEQNRDLETMKARIYKKFKAIEKRVVLLCDNEKPSQGSKILFDNIKSDKICLCKNLSAHKKQISKETKICSVILSEGPSKFYSNIPLRAGQRLIIMADALGGNEDGNLRFAELIDEMI